MKQEIFRLVDWSGDQFYVLPLEKGLFFGMVGEEGISCIGFDLSLEESEELAKVILLHIKETRTRHSWDTPSER